MHAVFTLILACFDDELNYLLYSGETFEGENFCRLVGREHFAEKTLSQNIIDWCSMPKILGENFRRWL